MPDRAVTVIGFVVAELRASFTPGSARPPLGGGTDTVHILAGETVVPPPWLAGDNDSCSDCGPYLWVRLARRWRAADQRSGGIFRDPHAGACGQKRAITIEVGIARCHPPDGTPQELEEHAAIQWDDSWRIDNALCRALKIAEESQVITDSAIGPGEPSGPEGLAISWLQTAHAQM
ncbi:hypothetical protein [Nocardia gipuzkoensis]|uniref:hypothetical protein n=1 Tax=Nocardia gipuzkoensis TaxID=2749991 RepID=UPI00237E5FC4|nr:hypothetical protein [Nocardia gipuzkoensis]MDE1673863.1 hypothetical protein [Nocardia gipuzkoensis]